MKMKDKLGIIEKFETPLQGCYELQPIVRKDNRGSFTKTFHIESFKELGLEVEFKEELRSISIKNVLRGLHFQTPPADHVKLVYCVEGTVIDVAVDLRKSSPTYGKFHMVTLDGQKCNMFYLPKGLAHGFYTLSDNAIMMYKLTSVYSPENDKGILWNSVGIPWPCNEPIISDRDIRHISFSDFDSPF